MAPFWPIRSGPGGAHDHVPALFRQRPTLHLRIGQQKSVKRGNISGADRKSAFYETRRFRNSLVGARQPRAVRRKELGRLPMFQYAVFKLGPQIGRAQRLRHVTVDTGEAFERN